LSHECTRQRHARPHDKPGELNEEPLKSTNAIQQGGLTRRPIYRYHLNMGELSVSEDGAGNDRGLAVLPPLFRLRLPGVPDDDTWTIETKVTGSMLTAVAGPGGKEAMARLWVVLDGQDLARIVSSPRVLDLPVPICIIEVLKMLPNPRMAEWLSHFADALALDWLQHMDMFGTDPGQPEFVGNSE
jgi:hypothetical protein